MNTEAQALIIEVVRLTGSPTNAAKALGVHHKGNIGRWLRGEREPGGATIVAARAIIRHPEEYVDA